MDELEESKPESVREKIARRDQLRREEISRKHAAMEITKAESEKAEFFRASLADKSRKIEESLNALTSSDDVSRPKLFDKINDEIMSLQKFIGVSTLFLKAFDTRRAHERFQELDQQYRQSKDQLMPKKKFGFKSRKLGQKKEAKDEVDTPQGSKVPPPINEVLQNLYIDSSTGFSNKMGETLSLSHEDVFRKDVSLTNLENCIILLHGSSSTLHVMSLRNCQIFSGPVATSVFIEDCTGCKFQVPCQQLRVHKTQDCNFYLHVKSRAIIEDTTQVRFAPYNWSYENIALHFELAGLDMNTNNWNSVDDFNWLASDMPSPNWRVLADDEQVADGKLNGNTN